MQPVPFLQKWIELSIQRDSVSQLSIAKHLGGIRNGGPVFPNLAGGERLRFTQGEIVMFDNLACAVYGAIYDVWTGVEGGWGRPLADEQDLEDGGRCSIFEGGHIHRYGDDARP